MSGGRSPCPLRPRSRSGHNTGVHRSAKNALQVPVLFYGPLRDMCSSRLLSPPYSVAEEMKKQPVRLYLSEILPDGCVG